ncbi:hypothetical protein IV454_24010 [Massilia antarctica]|uniref:Uncharacterized protein n=1 Tax=Massilia antarctica TaxID=2765360 RepID=A0AA48W9R6_9BURK|nr:hypothetical protein [Massilia antarctica]QPI48566.1 hypothetical protein IV454_24010 [Massilia antarctica]
MPAFPPPLSLRLNGGLRTEPFVLPLTPVETLLGVQLAPEDDLELGGAHYAYATVPTPARGLVDVLICANDPASPSSTYAARPDLLTALVIGWFGHNLLDLGRLEWQLRAAYGDLFDVAEYSIVTLPPADGAPSASEVHWVQHERTERHRGTPLAGTPTLACTLDVAFPAGCEGLARSTLDSLHDDTAAQIRQIQASALGDARTRLALSFDSPSLLDLGRYAQALELACGDSARVLAYAVSGDLQRDGHCLRVERRFASRLETLPDWLAAAPSTG